jgi:hypothetical protein
MSSQTGGRPKLESETPAAAQERIAKPWNFATRVLFRFACILLPLLILEFPIGLLNGELGVGAFGLVSLVNSCALWIVNHVFGIRHFSPNGDSVLEVARFAFMSAAAMAGAIGWSVLDRRRCEYRALHQWLRVLVRVALAYALLGYGSIKLIPMQMAPLATMRPHVLLIPVGFLPKQQMLWGYMGAAPGYETITGAVEMLAGVMLLVPRLATLGALLAVGALTNVFLLNVFYDVWLKFYSFLLVALALFVLLPDLRRLADVFVFNRTPAAVQEPPLFRNRRLMHALVAAQIVFGAGVISYKVSRVYSDYTRRAQYVSSVPFWGIWTVDEFALDGSERQPLTTDEQRWNRMVFEAPGRVFIQRMDGPVYWAGLKIDAPKHRMLLDRTQVSPDPFSMVPQYVAIFGAKWKADFVFENRSPDELVLRGAYDGHDAVVKLRRDKTRLLLTDPVQWVRR